jgi:hypothetical protein
MITKAQITRRASKEGVSARTVERDYVLAHVVAAVATSKKGGTALRMCHFKEFRYSVGESIAASIARRRGPV